jgi:hypothetical protein
MVDSFSNAIADPGAPCFVLCLWIMTAYTLELATDGDRKRHV